MYAAITKNEVQQLGVFATPSRIKIQFEIDDRIHWFCPECTLEGNDDTEYKRKLFELLTAHANTAIHAGQFQLCGENQGVTFTPAYGRSMERGVGRGRDTLKIKNFPIFRLGIEMNTGN